MDVSGIGYDAITEGLTTNGAKVHIVGRRK